MKQFKIGDEVIALKNQPDSSCQPRIKGEVYEVKDVMYCIFCGVQHINLGYPKISKGETVICGGCGGRGFNNGKAWTDSKHFALKEDKDKIMEKAVQEEDYEFAVILRDLKV